MFERGNGLSVKVLDQANFRRDGYVITKPH